VVDHQTALHGLVQRRGGAVALRLDREVVPVALRDDGLPIVEEGQAAVLARESVALVGHPRLELRRRVLLRLDAVAHHLLLQRGR
jgi:hypothetical protein